jgi:hypothetical protein
MNEDIRVPSRDGLGVKRNDWSIEKSTETNWLAVISFLLGWFSIVGGIPAIILGTIALDQIKATSEPVRGRGLALWGIWLGILGTLLLIVLLIFFFNTIHSADPYSYTP